MGSITQILMDKMLAIVTAIKMVIIMVHKTVIRTEITLVTAMVI